MVNCKNCGAPLSLNDAFCPNCGTPNPEAQEHIRKLKELDHQFQEAQSEVKEEVRKSKKGYGVLVILVMILLANLILIPFHMASYDIADSIKVSRMGDTEIRATLDSLMEEGDFAELYLFTEKYSLSYKDYGEYMRIASLARSYVYLIGHVTDYLYGTDNYSDPLVRACQCVTDFKTDYKNYLRWAEESDFIQYARQLEQDFDAVAKEYLRLTDEDLSEAQNMTDSELVIRVNERLNNETDK